MLFLGQSQEIMFAQDALDQPEEKAVARHYLGVSRALMGATGSCCQCSSETTLADKPPVAPVSCAYSSIHNWQSTSVLSLLAASCFCDIIPVAVDNRPDDP